MKCYKNFVKKIKKKFFDPEFIGGIEPNLDENSLHL